MHRCKTDKAADRSSRKISLHDTEKAVGSFLESSAEMIRAGHFPCSDSFFICYSEGYTDLTLVFFKTGIISCNPVYNFS